MGGARQAIEVVVAERLTSPPVRQTRAIPHPVVEIVGFVNLRAAGRELMQDVGDLRRRIIAVGRLRPIRQGRGDPARERIIDITCHRLLLRPGRLELGHRPGPIRHGDLIELTGEWVGTTAAGADAQAARRQARQERRPVEKIPKAFQLAVAIEPEFGAIADHPEPMPLPIIDPLRRRHADAHQRRPRPRVRSGHGNAGRAVRLELQLPGGRVGRRRDGTGQPVAHDGLAARRGGLDPQIHRGLKPESTHRAGEADLVVHPVELKGLSGQAGRDAIPLRKIPELVPWASAAVPSPVHQATKLAVGGGRVTPSPNPVKRFSPS